MCLPVPNQSHFPCIFKDLVHIWSGRVQKRKRLIFKRFFCFKFEQIQLINLQTSHSSSLFLGLFIFFVILRFNRKSMKKKHSHCPAKKKNIWLVLMRKKRMIKLITGIFVQRIMKVTAKRKLNHGE